MTPIHPGHSDLRPSDVKTTDPSTWPRHPDRSAEYTDYEKEQKNYNAKALRHREEQEKKKK